MRLTDRGTATTLALTIAAALTLAACQGGNTVTQSQSPTPTPTSTTASPPAPPPDFGTEVLVTGNKTVADATLTPAGARDAVAAGVLKDQRTIPGTDSHGKRTYAVAVMDDGTVVGGQSASKSPGPDQDKLSQTAVGVVDASGAFTPFSAASASELKAKGVDPSIARQSGPYDTRGRVVAWAETSSTNVVADNWVIFTHDLDTGVTRVLGASNEIVPDGHLPGMGPDTTPSIGTSRVFWGTSYPLDTNNPDDPAGFEILAAPLNGSSPATVVAKGALLPAADGDCVAFARGWGADASMPRGEIRIARVCGNGPEEPLAKLTIGADGGVGQLVADDGRVAWSSVAKDGAGRSHREVTVLDIATGGLTSVNLSAAAETSSQSVAGMSLRGNLLQWTTDRTRFVLDLSDNSLWSLPASEGYYGVYAADGWVGWQVADAGPASPSSVTIARWAR